MKGKSINANYWWDKGDTLQKVDTLSMIGI